ncbi:TPA: hypothetical protein QCV70_006138 [Bacillus cereus]|nr:hypothetical protein [Bacillus cereus]MEC2824658.1 hypothetical protein [Bacillus cereus]HDR6759093.1 hypothetical protein [Bacillus cereus]
MKNLVIVFCADGQIYILQDYTSEYTKKSIYDLLYGETVYGNTFTKEQYPSFLFYSYLIDYFYGVTSKL